MNPKIKKKPRSFDWNKLKLEYMMSDDSVSVSDILRKNGISNKNVGPYNKHTIGWLDQRKELRDRQLEAVKKKLVKATADEFDEYIKMLDVTRKQIAMFLRDNVKQGKDGAFRLANPSIGRLSEAALAIDRVLKSHRLIRNKTTENLGIQNYHMAIVKLLQETKEGKIIDLGKVEEIPEAADNDNNG